MQRHLLTKLQTKQALGRCNILWLFNYPFQIFSSLLINHNNDLTLSSEDLDYETEHEHRKRELNKGDSVYTVDLREFFQSQIQNLYGQVKPNYYFKKQLFSSSFLLTVFLQIVFAETILLLNFKM